MQVVHHRGLAAAVGACDGDQRGTIGQPLQIEGQLVQPEAVANAPETRSLSERGCMMRPVLDWESEQIASQIPRIKVCAPSDR